MIGLHDAPAAIYHADELDERPTLSKSILHLLLETSPAHARAAHPRLNPQLVREDDPKFDLGTAAHDLFLEGVDRIQVIYFDDWKKKAAQEARDEARSLGKIPMLERQAEQAVAMVGAIRAQLDAHQADPRLFSAGTPERTLVWEDNHGVLCRARLDWLRDDHLTIDDLKTTSRSANPAGWCRTTLYSIGADLQAAFYLRGARAVLDAEPVFRFVVVETHAPFAVAVVELGPAVLELANRKIDYALDVWARCLRDDAWPAYEPRVHTAELIPWEESRWLEREMRELA